MYLKKLELVGFKSFPEKTQFVFNSGITCIVGPNGCGKTNLLDALRWVLGEQKTSLLRGNKMEEVIFAGTRTLKPLGMAEVSLHIDNRNGGLPSQYSELTISRRLFRSGESEYLLNKVPCRLKDISDLFADTGLGSHAYSIIQQDMIDAILSDRAEDRRFLFEEAAGITKYKHRKKAAERKLEATEHDLLRLKDILSEVTTHVTSLKRQVNKAERYKQISEEMKGWNLYLSRVRYDRLLERKKEQALAVRAHEDRKIAAESQLDARFAELEQRRTAMTDLDHTLTEQSNTILALSEEAHRLESDIMVRREKKENLARLVSTNREEIVALTRRSEVLVDEKRRSETEQETLRGEIAAVSANLEQALTKQKGADDEYLQYRALAEDESGRLVALEGRISSGRTDSANVEEQVSELQGEIEQQNTRKHALIEEKNRRRQEIASLQDQIAALRSAVNTAEGAIEDQQRHLSETEAEIDRLRDRQAELSSSYEATLARKNLLAEMVEHYEGYGSGVVAIFEVADRWPAITGAVADVVRPNAGMQAAIEAALGEAAQYILCQNYDSARDAVSFLRDNKAGRATFLIIDKLPESGPRPALPAIVGVTGWADALVTCDERYGRVASALLGQTVVCETAETARQALEALPGGYRAVTLGGDLLSGFGAMTGGASEEVSLIGRKDEIGILDGRVRDLD
ncbi:MAG: chromosome segregation protein SMC, partial [candidate division Zixibacteria bacterium]|nr:chromosome segregation protein SMC [candidate division Zixibacteria bacterium]